MEFRNKTNIKTDIVSRPPSVFQYLKDWYSVGWYLGVGIGNDR